MSSQWLIGGPLFQVEREREREGQKGPWVGGKIHMGWIYCLLLKTSQDSWDYFGYQKSEMVGTRLTHGTCVYRTA